MKVYHVTSETNVEKIKEKGLQPGQPSCVRTVHELTKWYLDEGKFHPGIFEKAGGNILADLLLEAITGAVGRCVEAESVYLSPNKSYAIDNCLAWAEVSDNLNGRLEVFYQNARKPKIDQTSEETIKSSLEEIIKERPCMLCEFELADEDIKSLTAPPPPKEIGVPEETRGKEIILTHVPPDKMENFKCEAVPKDTQVSRGIFTVTHGIE